LNASDFSHSSQSSRAFCVFVETALPSLIALTISSPDFSPAISLVLVAQEPAVLTTMEALMKMIMAVLISVVMAMIIAVVVPVVVIAVADVTVVVQDHVAVQDVTYLDVD
jgi:hypothetical protein